MVYHGVPVCVRYLRFLAGTVTVTDAIKLSLSVRSMDADRNYSPSF